MFVRTVQGVLIAAFLCVLSWEVAAGFASQVCVVESIRPSGKMMRHTMIAACEDGTRHTGVAPYSMTSMRGRHSSAKADVGDAVFQSPLWPGDMRAAGVVDGYATSILAFGLAVFGCLGTQAAFGRRRTLQEDLDDLNA